MNPTQAQTSKHAQALTKAQEYFTQEKIPLPYLSETDKSKLISISQDIFGTYAKHPGRPYDINLYVDKALSTPGEYVLFGIDGHGVESQAMHYYAVKEHVAIFIQKKMGAMEDQNVVRKNIKAIFHGISLIFEALEKSENQHLIAKGKRLLIVDSDFRPEINGWEWITGNPGKISGVDWQTEEPILFSALINIPIDNA